MTKILRKRISHSSHGSSEGDDDDDLLNDDDSSLSSASLQLGKDDAPASVRKMQAAVTSNNRTPASAVAGANKSNGGGMVAGDPAGYGSEDGLDLEMGMSDDSVDELKPDSDNVLRVSMDDQLRDSLLHPSVFEKNGDKQQAGGADAATIPTDPDEEGRLACRRIFVVWSIGLSAGATAVLTWLNLSSQLPLPKEMVEWLLPILVAVPYLLVALSVFFLDQASRQIIIKWQREANRNTAIVNSLFPENVRSRMLKRESKIIKKESRDRSSDSGKGLNENNNKANNASISSFTGSWIRGGSVGSRESRSRRRRQQLKERKEQRRKGGRKEVCLQSSEDKSHNMNTNAIASSSSGADSPANRTMATTETNISTILGPSLLTPAQESRPSGSTIETTVNNASNRRGDDTDDEDGLIPKDILTTKPIADFFPHCTVLFADIVGFTAWSSVRDPTAVFTLLESLYSCFDGIARKLRVFKVETIGDCYVAVTGLPDPMENHAVVMAQFARSCMYKMLQIVRALEKHLGPDTGDLSMRFGLHSGPVTAGVMRGEKSRFQLFGDTVNTAARIETTGERDKVHLSAQTADLLVEAGKQHWVQLREQKVQAKGKGKLQTYWLAMGGGGTSSNKNGVSTLNDSGSSLLMQPSSSAASDDDRLLDGHTSVKKLLAVFEKQEKLNTMGERTRRQATYTVEVLTQILKKLVAQQRGAQPIPAATPVEIARFTRMEALLENRTPLEDVNEAIDFASYLKAMPSSCKADKVQLSRTVLNQLEDFTATIASMYKNHAFHCWEHASHVTISLTKLHARLVPPKETSESQGNVSRQWGRRTGNTSESSQSNAAFGIPNDPMSEFALVFAAMIHDIDHPGVANAKLVKENAPMVRKYGKKSPAEQNSLDVAWEVFQRPVYKELRRHIYSNEEEMLRFRQLVATLVMATDMLDRDKAKDRQKRWDKLFAKKSNGSDPADIINRKATIVLETMVQISNIAHCFQHWNVFIKWNKKLFQEMCDTYRTGRQSGQKDPAEFWYTGEQSFFDEVVIPLVDKLKECGAFGEDAEEFVSYAKSNQREFKAKGRDLVHDYLSEIRGGSAGAGINGLTGTRHSTSTHSGTTISSLWSSDGSIKFKSPSSGKWAKSPSSIPAKKNSSTSRPSNPRRSPTP